MVSDRIAVPGEVLAALRARAARGPIAVRLLVPNPAPAEWHPTHPERHAKADAAQRVLDQTLPSLREAAGVPIDGFVSTRHDPLDAIEELLHDEPIDELILATTPHHIEGWLHADLPHRAAHLGLPVTAVEGTRALELIDPRAHRRIGPSLGRRMLNKVPEVTLFFWIIKIMCTTVGETAADYLNDNLGLGLTNTTYVAAALLVALLAGQFRARRYVPGLYWSVVVVISVFGTLITDNLTDGYGVSLTTTTPLSPGSWPRSSRCGGRSSGRCRSTPSSPLAATRSTGWRSSSPSRSARRPVTSRRRSSTSATPSRSSSSPASSPP